MAILQISQIQVRRGLQQDLPQLAGGEFGWSVDTRRLFIGNGLISEGAPSVGVTELLTQHSDFTSLLGTYQYKGLAAGFQAITGPDALNPTVRSLQDKLDEVVSVKDFGAIGDGVNDDTLAIQRAMNNALATNQGTLLQGHHRTILFPAGEYLITATLNIPPYIRLQGEGKRTTNITGTFAGPLARFVDGFGQYGTSYGYADVDGNTPTVSEYHLSDLALHHQSPTYDQSCLVIDGCFTATFNRCMFRGLLNDASSSYEDPTSLANPVWDLDRGPGIAGVSCPNISLESAVKNMVFSQCDFYQINYGIEFDQDCHGINFNNCFFDQLYCGIIMGYNTPNLAAYAPYGIGITNNYFRYSAIEAVRCNSYVRGIVSQSNEYLGYGFADWIGANPTLNPLGIALTPAISFSADNNYSIGDYFDTSSLNSVYGSATQVFANNKVKLTNVSNATNLIPGTTIKFDGTTSIGGIVLNIPYYITWVQDNSPSNYIVALSTKLNGSNVAFTAGTGTLTFRQGAGLPTVPYVQSNGYETYQVIQNIGVVNGRKTLGRGKTLTLANASSFTSASISYVPDFYTNLTMEYTLKHEGYQRTGIMKIARVGTTYHWDDDYVENGNTEVVFQANTTTGDIEYTSASSGYPTTFTYNLNYFN